jgi:hypothetical protein
MAQSKAEVIEGQETPATSQNFPKLPIHENGKAVNEPVKDPVTPSTTTAVAPGADLLTEPQRIAITLMVAGRPLVEVAHGAGVDRRTIYTWRHHHHEFRAELERRRAEIWEETADRIRALLDPAVRMLEEQVHARYDQHRYRAARTILRLARVGPAIAVKQREEGGEAAASDE